MYFIDYVLWWHNFMRIKGTITREEINKGHNIELPFAPPILYKICDFVVVKG
jgi:hypothetical protein